MERRSRGRCPECQGPTVEKDGQEKCRNSLCLYNHKGLKCKICHSENIQVSYQKEAFEYKCLDCHHKLS